MCYSHNLPAFSLKMNLWSPFRSPGHSSSDHGNWCGTLRSGTLSSTFLGLIYIFAGLGLYAGLIGSQTKTFFFFCLTVNPGVWYFDIFYFQEKISTDCSFGKWFQMNEQICRPTWRRISSFQFEKHHVVDGWLEQHLVIPFFFPKICVFSWSNPCPSPENSRRIIPVSK